MSSIKKTEASLWAVVLAFALVYIVWGSTYFFIQVVLHQLPVAIVGTLRFFAAAIIMLLICLLRKENVWNKKQILTGMFTGFLLLFFSNGGVMIAELTIPSSFVAVMGAATPFWFVVLDKPMWRTNFSSVATISGIILGFVGVCLLLGDRILHFEPSGDGHLYILGLVILVMSNISWAAGSLFAQKKAKGSAWVNTAWQMVGAGTAFLIASIIKNDWATVAWTEVTFETWGSLLYLIIFGSIAGYSAYVWLLSVRPAAQVSTYAYVNPIVALLLGYAWGNELITGLQLIGLGIILTSVLLINKSKHKKTNTTLTESKDI